ncbi:MAG: hypothetical protein OEU26_19700 [Candidatus Tectomicrobia bacterium]|nr:hypothetical protein [Candidatus Tectomicrobia bacterium]
MSTEETSSNEEGKAESRPYRVRLPGFVTDDDVGLGDAIKRVTYAVGIKPCGGCERRAATLNRWVAFSGRQRR